MGKPGRKFKVEPNTLLDCINKHSLELFSNGTVVGPTNSVYDIISDDLDRKMSPYAVYVFIKRNKLAKTHYQEWGLKGDMPLQEAEHAIEDRSGKGVDETELVSKDLISSESMALVEIDHSLLYCEEPSNTCSNDAAIIMHNEEPKVVDSVNGSDSEEKTIVEIDTKEKSLDEFVNINTKDDSESLDADNNSQNVNSIETKLTKSPSGDEIFLNDVMESVVENFEEQKNSFDDVDFEENEELKNNPEDWIILDELNEISSSDDETDKLSGNINSLPGDASCDIQEDHEVKIEESDSIHTDVCFSDNIEIEEIKLEDVEESSTVAIEEFVFLKDGSAESDGEDTNKMDVDTSVSKDIPNEKTIMTVEESGLKVIDSITLSDVETNPNDSNKETIILNNEEVDTIEYEEFVSTDIESTELKWVYDGSNIDIEMFKFDEQKENIININESGTNASDSAALSNVIDGEKITENIKPIILSKEELENNVCNLVNDAEDVSVDSINVSLDNPKEEPFVAVKTVQSLSKSGESLKPTDSDCPTESVDEIGDITSDCVIIKDSPVQPEMIEDIFHPEDKESASLTDEQSNKEIQSKTSESKQIDTVSPVDNSSLSETSKTTEKDVSDALRKRSASSDLDDLDGAETKRFKHDAGENLLVENDAISVSNECNTDENDVEITLSSLKRTNTDTKLASDIVKKPKLNSSEETDWSVCCDVIEECLKFAETNNSISDNLKAPLLNDNLDTDKACVTSVPEVSDSSDSISDIKNSVKSSIETTDSDKSDISNSRYNNFRRKEVNRKKVTVPTKSKGESQISQKTISNIDLAIERVVEQSRIDPEKKVPLLKRFHKDQLKNLTRHDLEELIIVKLCEAITDRSVIGELRQRCDKIEQIHNQWKKKAMQLDTSHREMKMILERYFLEASNIKKKSPPLPVKIVRSVGIQVQKGHVSPLKSSSHYQRQPSGSNKASNSPITSTPKPPLPGSHRPRKMDKQQPRLPNTIDSEEKENDNPFVSWIYKLSKTELEEEMRKVNLPSKGTVREMRPLLSAFIRGKTLPPSRPSKVEEIELRHNLGHESPLKSSSHYQRQPSGSNKASNSPISSTPKPPLPGVDLLKPPKTHVPPRSRFSIATSSAPTHSPKAGSVEVIDLTDEEEENKKVEQKQHQLEQQQKQQLILQQLLQQNHQAKQMTQQVKQPTPIQNTPNKQLQQQQSPQLNVGVRVPTSVQQPTQGIQAILVPISAGQNGTTRPPQLFITTPTGNQIRALMPVIQPNRPTTSATPISINGNSTVMPHTSHVIPLQQTAGGVIRPPPATLPIMNPQTGIQQIRPQQPVFKVPIRALMPVIQPNRPTTSATPISINGNSTVMPHTSHVIPLQQTAGGVIRPPPATLPIMNPQTGIQQIRPQQPVFKVPIRASMPVIQPNRPTTSATPISINGNSTVMPHTSHVIPLQQTAGGVIRPPPATLPIMNPQTGIQQIRPQQPVFKVPHPVPLHLNTQHAMKPGMKLPPPKPQLKIENAVNGILLSWSMAITEDVADIASYQLYAYDECSQPPNTASWKKVGDIKALPLPMACTLSQLVEGHKYQFSVRAVDVHSRIGLFSEPRRI